MILRSQIDKSVNIITPVSDGGYFEARFVERDGDTIIVYLSSLSGCDRACRFCHLTQTGQTMTTYATLEDYEEQTRKVLTDLRDHGDLSRYTKLHFNFMARGDALSNPHFTEQSSEVFALLTRVSRDFLDGIKPKFKISTIFPSDTYTTPGYKGLQTDLVDVILKSSTFLNHDVEFYYSLYSLRSSFRKRWIPKSLDPEMVGAAFKGRDSGLRLHHALIAGQNDTEEDVALIHDWLERHDIKAKLNIVRYNPYDSSCGEEADDEAIQTYLTQMKLSHRITDVQIVSRVGSDVKASCGTFIE